MRSELAVAQEFVPSEFDWRIGVLDGKALYACRYHMAPGHWQVVKSGHHGRRRWGKVDTLLVADAPPKAVPLAERCAELVGDGLYGVDIKEVDGRFLVIEVNDNPSIEGGEEDRLLKDELYDEIMGVIYRRLELKGRERAGVVTPPDAASAHRSTSSQATGIELEYMIVDARHARRASDRRPAARRRRRATTAATSSAAPVAWSNELALHVIELKTNGPVPRLGGVARAACRSTSGEIERAARAARRAPDADRDAPADGSRTRELRALAARERRHLPHLRPHLRLPRPRLGQPAERARQPAVRGRRRVRAPPRRDPRRAADPAGARRELAGRPTGV